MNFAPYTPYEAPTPVTTKPLPVTKRNSVETLVQALGPTAKKLNSTWLNGCAYYYLPNTNAVVEISGFTNIMRKPERKIEDDIRRTNGLPLETFIQ